MHPYFIQYNLLGDLCPLFLVVNCLPKDRYKDIVVALLVITLLLLD